MGIATHIQGGHESRHVSELPLPSPFELITFLDAIAAQRGRRFELRPGRLGATATCGRPEVGDTVDYLDVPSDPTSLHGERAILHQVGHILLGHTTAQAGETAEALREEQLLQHVLPDLSIPAIRRVLDRAVYTSAQEQQAERFVVEVLIRAGRLPRPRSG